MPTKLAWDLGGVQALLSHSTHGSYVFCSEIQKRFQCHLQRHHQPPTQTYTTFGGTGIPVTP